jgi:hypothetical protein
MTARVQTEPLLSRGWLSGRVFLVTRWRDLGEGRIEALKKTDITEQYEALRASDNASDAASPCRCVETEEGGMDRTACRADVHRDYCENPACCSPRGHDGDCDERAGL